MHTTNHTSATQSRGYGVEVDLLFHGNRPPRTQVIGGIPNYQASTHSLQYRNEPCSGAMTPDVAESALIQGF